MRNPFKRSLPAEAAPRLLPHRHTGMVLGGTAQFTCTTCGESCWQPKDTSAIQSGLQFELVALAPRREPLPTPDPGASHAEWVEKVAAYMKRWDEEQIEADHAIAVAKVDALSRLYPSDAVLHADRIAEIRDPARYRARKERIRAEYAAKFEAKFDGAAA
jgi:hypothetical protein